MVEKINSNKSSKSSIRSLITVPKDAGIAILSVFFNIAHLVISPILGKRRLAKYPTITAMNARKELTLKFKGFSNNVHRYPLRKWLMRDSAIEIYTKVKFAFLTFSKSS